MAKARVTVGLLLRSCLIDRIFGLPLGCPSHPYRERNTNSLTVCRGKEEKTSDRNDWKLKLRKALLKKLSINTCQKNSWESNRYAKFLAAVGTRQLPKTPFGIHNSLENLW